MTSTVDQRVQSCPDCGTEVRTQYGFVPWCADCDWNVDPGGAGEPAGRLETLRRGLARRHGERLYAEVSADAVLRPRRDLHGMLALALALAVHGVTAALIVGGLLLVVLGWGTALPLLGALCLVLAFALRPRFGRLPEHGPLLLRGDAPELFALIDEVAAAVGTTGVHTVAITDEVNASVSTYGIRQRRVLTVGLGLWEILTPQERIALLGHELGHYANGDARHGLVIGNALQSLGAWWYLLARTPNPTFAEAAVNAVCLLPRCAVLGLLMLLDQLTLRATQRGEYLADSWAARCGSTEAAVGLIDRLLTSDSAATTLLRESNALKAGRPGDGGGRDAWRGLWERLAAHMDSVPASEHERLLRRGARHGHGVDSTHPPTHLRRSRLLAAPPVPATVTADTARRTALDAELCAARDRVARRVVNGR
ncbi:M48 family metallopeptidase [Streptomyces sp. RKAG290]|uniref:M48 family metallopeptidase n=1 Tax=Streptomyces sp. RKAG290 TaxID=2888348 RepID=UPI0020335D0C|nr:M48 family metallopeptidase [Streptomyces sp. RKAG290]MCM2412179.1 M48 family metallopeptidase [Streptomyces sp. RKAG290]